MTSDITNALLGKCLRTFVEKSQKIRTNLRKSLPNIKIATVYFCKWQYTSAALFACCKLGSFLPVASNLTSASCFDSLWWSWATTFAWSEAQEFCLRGCRVSEYFHEEFRCQTVVQCVFFSSTVVCCYSVPLHFREREMRNLIWLMWVMSVSYSSVHLSPCRKKKDRRTLRPQAKAVAPAWKLGDDSRTWNLSSSPARELPGAWELCVGAPSDSFVSGCFPTVD